MLPVSGSIVLRIYAATAYAVLRWEPTQVMDSCRRPLPLLRGSQQSSTGTLQTALPYTRRHRRRLPHSPEWNRPGHRSGTPHSCDIPYRTPPAIDRYAEPDYGLNPHDWTRQGKEFPTPALP
jgi:hypothetical protein